MVGPEMRRDDEVAVEGFEGARKGRDYGGVGYVGNGGWRLERTGLLLTNRGARRGRGRDTGDLIYPWLLLGRGEEVRECVARQVGDK